MMPPMLVGAADEDGAPVEPPHTFWWLAIAQSVIR